MKKNIYWGIIILFGCISTNKFFTSIKHSEQGNYGYSVDNPILIGQYSNWQKNTDLALYYLSKLNCDNRPLYLIMHASVEKPFDQPKKRESIPRRYGMPPPSMGGKYLDLYVLVPKETNDTLNLYFDVEIKGEIKIPQGLEFDINQSNNIFR